MHIYRNMKHECMNYVQTMVCAQLKYPSRGADASMAIAPTAIIIQ